MAPPAFGDLGKDARELLTKHYYFGILNTRLATSLGDFNVTNTINQNFKTKTIGSSIESKLKFPKYGTTITNKWGSGNILDCEVSVEDKVYPGLKQNFKYSRETFTSVSTATAMNSLKSEKYNAQLDMFFKSAMPDLSPSLVISHSGYLAGVEMKLDCANRLVQRANFAVGYAVQDFAFHGLISNWGKRFSASLSQRINDRLEMAGSVSWSRENEEVAWSVGTKFVLDDENKHFFKAKLDHLTRVSLSLTTYFTKDLQFTLCGLFNGPEMPQLGIGVELEC
ncbi:Voltage-dependent anion-selective channel protein 2 [Fasciolopsis buskii]|uniref:Voltage-dependent anion-selective channel protein 2 n=1 Tax=Fasciolopsis buskii TaxID=27845 RepID=A0A8E0VH79_9TREM|nr:Voltage-dependent anion-selective channel protein 2 [Fasciolopsis buski]